MNDTENMAQLLSREVREKVAEVVDKEELAPGVYVPIGVPFLDVGTHVFAVCVMKRELTTHE